MAVPKRKMSRSNTRHRRSQWKAVAPSLVTCANPACGEGRAPPTGADTQSRHPSFDPASAPRYQQESFYCTSRNGV